VVRDEPKDEQGEKAKDEPKEDSSEEQGDSEEYSTEEELTEKSDHDKKEEDHNEDLDEDHIEAENPEAVGHSERKMPDFPVSLLEKDSAQEEKEVEVNTRQTTTTLRWIFLDFLPLKKYCTWFLNLKQSSASSPPLPVQYLRSRSMTYCYLSLIH
jgi:hypothetical protein